MNEQLNIEQEFAKISDAFNNGFRNAVNRREQVFISSDIFQKVFGDIGKIGTVVKTTKNNESNKTRLP